VHNPIKPDEKNLREALERHPADWKTRTNLARFLHDQGSFREAADVIWDPPEIPNSDVELEFAARMLAQGHRQGDPLAAESRRGDASPAAAVLWSFRDLQTNVS